MHTVLMPTFPPLRLTSKHWSKNYGLQKKCFMPFYIVYIYSGINENVFYAVQANDRKQPINRHWNIETF